MKSVMISIKPKWCKLIAKGKKTVEVRKTRPKLETPFKVYIYETKALYKPNGCNHLFKGEGKVIGEFVCDEIIGGFWVTPFADYLQKQSCLSYREVWDYSNGKPIFSWHISDLVIYDKPKELSEFRTLKQCNACKDGYESTACIYDADCKVPVPLKRPLQSWCYVESGKY